MTNDHLAAAANQKKGTLVLLEMVSAGYLTPEEAMAEIEARRKSMNLAQKLASWFSRAMFNIAG